MSKRAIYIVFWLAVAAFVAFAVLMERVGPPPVRVRVEARQVSGYGFVDRDTVRAYVERNLAKVAPDSVSGRLLPLEKRIQRNPYVEKVRVYRRPSGEVWVDLWEEIPSFRLITDTGNYYVSRADRLMPVRAGCAVEVPLVCGPVAAEAFDEIRRIVERIDRDDLFSGQVVGIRVSARRKNAGTVYDYSLDTRLGLEVALGAASDLDTKFENFGIIYSYLHSAGKTDDYKVVNLEFGNYVICKKK